MDNGEAKTEIIVRFSLFGRKLEQMLMKCQPIDAGRSREQKSGIGCFSGVVPVTRLEFPFLPCPGRASFSSSFSNSAQRGASLTCIVPTSRRTPNELAKCTNIDSTLSDQAVEQCRPSFVTDMRPSARVCSRSLELACGRNISLLKHGL